MKLTLEQIRIVLENRDKCLYRDGSDFVVYDRLLNEYDYYTLHQLVEYVTGLYEEEE